MMKRIVTILILLCLGSFVTENTFAATKKFQIRLSIIDPTTINIEDYDIDFENILGKKIADKQNKEQKIFVQGKDGIEVEVILSKEETLLSKDDLGKEELVSKQEKKSRSNESVLITSVKNKSKENLNVIINYR